MDQIVPNLPFEVVTVPQDEPTNTSHTTPIKVKIKMKKGDNKSIPRQRVISVPKMRPIYPEISRRVHSDETIMCFNIHMEPEIETKPRRKSQNKFFQLFKTGKCLETQDEDDNDPPYMLATPVKSSDVKSQFLIIEVQDKKHKNNIETFKNISKPPVVIFGKCKPGGCLDPPFGEDKYQYYPSILSKHDLKVEEVENTNKPREDVLNEAKQNSKTSGIAVKNSNYNESDVSSTYMLYRADPGNEILNDKYSDSIITYPTRTSSRDLSILEKNISKKSSSIRNRQLNIDTYFTPRKISKSHERKKESLIKNHADLNSDQKEKIKHNPPESIIPKLERTRALLLEDSDIGIENIQSKNQELISQSNNKLSHVFEASENILLTVHQIQEPVTCLKSKPDKINIIPEIGGVINPLENVTENKMSKNENVNVNEINSSSLEISEESQNLNTLPLTNTNVFNMNEEQFNMSNTESNQVHHVISNHSLRNKTSHKDSNENMTKNFIEEERLKEGIIDPSKPETEENRLDTLSTLDIKHDSFLYYNEKNTVGINPNELNEQKVHLLDIHFPNKTLTNIENTDIVIGSIKNDDELNNGNLNMLPETLPIEDNDDKYLKDNYLNLPTEILPNIENNTDLVRDNSINFNSKSNDKLSEHLTKVVNDSKSQKRNNDDLESYEHLNVSPNIKLGHVNTSSVVSNLDKELALNNNLTPKKLSDKFRDNVGQNKNIIAIDDEIQTLKEKNSGTKLSMSISVNTSPDFSLNKANTSLIDNIRRLSDSNFSHNNIIITPEKVSDIIDDTKLNQFLENEKSASQVNISAYIPQKNVISTEEQDTVPKTFFTTTKEVDINDNFSENIETNVINKVDVNDITDNQDTINTEKNTEIDSNLFPTNVGPQKPDYKILDSSSATVSLENKVDVNAIYKNENQQFKVNKSYQSANEITNNKNIPTFSEITLSDLEFQTTKIIDEKISNESSTIVSNKHTKTENAMGIPYYNKTSKIHLTTRSSKLDVNSIEPNLSTVTSINAINNIDSHISSNVNSTTKYGLNETFQTPYTHVYNESTETTNKEKNKIEWTPNNDTKNNTLKSIKGTKSIIIDLGFQTYMSENGETVLKTFNPSQEPQRFSQDRIFVKRSALKSCDSELSFAINSNTRLSLKVDNNINNPDESSFELEESPIETTQRIYRNSKFLYDVNDVSTLQETLSVIYENDLIPMERLIRSLRLEVDRLSKYGQLIRTKSVAATKKHKPVYSKRCVCTRKWNNYG